MVEADGVAMEVIGATGGLLPATNVLVPVAAQAGYVSEEAQERAHELSWVMIPGIEGRAATFEVAGESMQPVVWHGDFLVCRPIERLEDVKSGDLYVLVSKNGVAAKYLTLQSGGLLCTSENQPTYAPYFEAEADVLEIWAPVMRLTASFLHPRLAASLGDIGKRLDRIEAVLSNTGAKKIG